MKQWVECVVVFWMIAGLGLLLLVDYAAWGQAGEPGINLLTITHGGQDDALSDGEDVDPGAFTVGSPTDAAVPDAHYEFQPMQLQVSVPSGLPGCGSTVNPVQLELTGPHKDLVILGEGGTTPIDLETHEFTSSTMVLIQPTAPSVSVGDIEITAYSEECQTIGDDVVVATAFVVDLDIDSDNNNDFNRPAGTRYEERIEDEGSTPGKLVFINTWDVDGDGTPNFAEGFKTDAFDNEGYDIGGSFVPLTLRFPRGLDFQKAEFLFQYSESDPHTVTPPVTADDAYSLPPGGHLRLWLKDGNQLRQPYSVRPISPDAEPGDVVKSGYGYTLADLGATEFSNSLTLYVEGVRVSSTIAAQSIKVSLDPFGTKTFLDQYSDTVRLTVVDIGWIDTSPTYAGSDVQDSDNFFLRHLLAEDTRDWEELDLWYRILPEDLLVQETQIKIYPGMEETPCKTIDVQEELARWKGDSIPVRWNGRDDDGNFREVGFYRIQLAMKLAGGSENGGLLTIQTSVDDADKDLIAGERLLGWQCPQRGLAIHDLAYKHRPDVYVGNGEDIAPNGPVYPFSPGIINNYRLVQNDSPAWERTMTVDNYFGFGEFPDPENPVLNSSYKVLQDSMRYDREELEDNEIDHYIDIRNDQRNCDTGLPYLLYRGHPYDGSERTHPNYVFIQYWMYTTSSHAPYHMISGGNKFVHEADWEMVQMTTQLRNPNFPGKKAEWLLPYAATASQHHYGQTLAWRINVEDGLAGIWGNEERMREQRYVSTTDNGNRVKIFIAENAHATYFRDGDIDAEVVFQNAGVQVQYFPPSKYFDRISQPRKIIAYKLLALEYLTGEGIYGWPGYWGRETLFVSPNVRSPRFSSVKDMLNRVITKDIDPAGFHQSCRKLVDEDGDFLPYSEIQDPETELD